MSTNHLSTVRLQRSFWCMSTVAFCSTASLAQPSLSPDASFWRPSGPVHSVVLASDRVYLGGEFGYIGPYTGGVGVVDPNVGASKTSFPIVAGIVTAAVSDGQGGWFIGGQFTSVGAVPRSNLAHVLADGSVNQTWDPAPNGTNAVMVLTGNRLYVGGAFTQIGGATRNRAAALDPATGQVLEWNPNCSGTVEAFGIAGSTVYLGGSFAKVGGQTRNRLAAVDSVTGSLLTWKPSVSGGGNVVNAIAVSGGTVYVGGSFTTLGTKPRNNIGALNTASDIAEDWNPNANGIVRDLVVSDNLLYAAGEFTSIGAEDRNRLAVLDTSTSLATTWDPNADGAVLTMSLVGNTLYVGGAFSTIGGAAHFHAASFDTVTGSANTWSPKFSTFGASTHRVMALAPGVDAMLIGGDFTSLGGFARGNGAALDLASGAATEWDPQANSAVGVLAAHNGTVYAGGAFTSIGGQSRGCLAALDADTGLATDWNPVVAGKSAKVSALAFSDSTVFVGGVFTSVGGAERNGLAALSLETGEALLWDAAPVGISTSKAPAINTLLLSADELFVGGDFAKLGGQPRLRIGAVDTQLANVLDWNPMASNALAAMALARNTLFVGGSFTNIGGKTRSYAAALDPATGSATSWNPGPNKGVTALALAGNSVYVGGDFTTVGGEFRNRLAIVSLATGQSGGWDPNMNALVRALVVKPDAVYVGGDFTTVGGKAHRYFAVFPIALGFLSTPDSTQVTGTGEFEATLQVADGERLIIQASMDLVHWDNIQTNTPTGTSIQLKDAAPTVSPYRFYRARLEQ